MAVPIQQIDPVDAAIEKMLEPVGRFLLCATPEQWVAQAVDYSQTLLVDHANCEKKAASTALNLMYRYTDYPELLAKMSRLAREELRHFEQVLAIMQRRNIEYRYVSPSRYAGALRDSVSTHEPARLLDTLIVGAIIEARSCERFARLVPVLAEVDSELSRFYASLLKSEARHFKDYLSLGKKYCNTGESGFDFDRRVSELLAVEADLVTKGDNEFRFHSGPFVGESVSS